MADVWSWVIRVPCEQPHTFQKVRAKRTRVHLLTSAHLSWSWADSNMPASLCFTNLAEFSLRQIYACPQRLYNNVADFNFWLTNIQVFELQINGDLLFRHARFYKPVERNSYIDAIIKSNISNILNPNLSRKNALKVTDYMWWLCTVTYSNWQRFVTSIAIDVQLVTLWTCNWMYVAISLSFNSTKENIS